LQNQGLNIGLALSDTSDYSLLLIFSFLSLTGYRKIVDFIDRSSHNGFYNRASALNFFPLATGGSVFAANTQARLILTRDSPSD